MKILLINNQHYLMGGAHRVYLNTGQLLEDNGHDVAYFSTFEDKTLDSKYKDYFVPSIDFKKLRLAQKIKVFPYFLYNKKIYKAVTRIVHDFKPDIAHVHLFYGGLTVSLLKALKDNNVPIVHSVHDYKLICPAYTFLDSKNNICEKCKNGFFINCTLRRCSKGSFFNSLVFTIEAYYWKWKYNPAKLIDHFIFVSKFIRDKHIEFNKVYENKNSVLYNFNKSDIVVNKTIYGDYLFYFGRLSHEKGLRTLLKAVSETNVKLIIAGTGPLEFIVKDFASNNSNINYVGFKNGNELNNLILNSSYVVVPSEWYENNPMTIVESFSLKKAVIGARIGGIPELVHENKTGFLFKAGSEDDLKRAINKAVNIKEEDYICMSENVKKIASDFFDIDYHYKKLISIYNKLK